ncbi:DGQHR domain-containing protein [Congregibacter litoralis]|uniref:DNA-sulfur modification-associated n=1 Tax=Congregibacter litoralis KT71 TaxID=314285 RepID=V7HUW0_9GAMM|nr:DGQHR domain-containing protein [Congregibacter litoralis]ESZ89327.1 DNA-sulfur modification-associated [Congregibacter litoralis KT71]
MMSKITAGECVHLIKFTQWLEHWDNFEYSVKGPSRKPKPNLYMFSMNAAKLRQYSDVYRRQRSSDNAEGIQRDRDEKRTDRIRRFVQDGYPYGDLKENQRNPDREVLKKPGWLPTAIVVNILEEGDPRRGKVLNLGQGGVIIEKNGVCELQLPDISEFEADAIRPLEVIDGQHRLWAFDDSLTGDYELPVVAFHGLDIAWQAYLFWSINVSPKRINPSHAFDLYPLLRNQTWLEQTGDLTVYREARAQEITEWLYKHHQSPWFNRVNMLGESGAGRVSQAAFVRSLTAAFFGTGRGTSGRYGLFQAAFDENGEPLPWTRAQQVALLLEFWTLLANQIGNSTENWVIAFRQADRNPLDDKSVLLNQDMGVRAVHAVANDILFEKASQWGLNSWSVDVFDETDTSEDDIDTAWESLKNQEFHRKLRSLTSSLVKFDWRSLDGPGVRDDRDLELTRRAYRGSGGYTLLTKDILRVIEEASDPSASSAGQDLRKQS